MTTKSRASLALLSITVIVGVSLSGCAHYDPTRVKADFGNSTKAVLAAQYFDPQVAANPSPLAPTGMDGAKAGNILKEYREDVSDRDFGDTQQPITVLTAPGG